MTEKEKPKESEQIRAFRKAARDLDCDPNPDKFDAALKDVATAIGNKRQKEPK